MMMYSPFTATTINGVYLLIASLLAFTDTMNNPPYFCHASVSSVLVSSGSTYNLIPRDDTRYLQQDSSTPSTTTTESPMLISFDGDLDAIRAQALSKANNTSVVVPVERPPNSYTCDNETTTHLEIVNWIYSIETVARANIETVYGEVSEITVDMVAPQTLTCYNNASAFANIVAMDSAVPGHEISTSETCQPELDPSNTCTIMIGRMRVFLSNKDTVQEATALVLKHIQESYDDPGFVDMVNSGIVDITYFTSDDNTGSTGENAPPPIKDEDDADKDEVPVAEESDSRLGLSSVLFVGMGSAMLVLFVGSVYFYRRGRNGSNGDDEDGVHGSSASRFANMTMNDTATLEQNDKDNPNEANRPMSPYSEMVSNSYRLDRLQEMSILSSSNMSPVYELEGNETDTDTVGGGGSIMISEGGYTTDAGNTEEGDSTMFESTTVDGSKYSSSQSTVNVLGARPFPGTIGNFDMEEVSDSDLDTSCGDMSPVKMYVGNALTANSTQNKLLVLPSGQDPTDDENEDNDDSLLFGSPTPSKGVPPSFSGINMVNSDATTVQVTNNNHINNSMSLAPTDEGDINSSTHSTGSHTTDILGGGGDDVESAIGSMSATSPMSHNTTPSIF